MRKRKVLRIFVSPRPVNRLMKKYHQASSSHPLFEPISREEHHSMKKTYVLDTNVLLYNPEAIFAFEDNEVVIPLAVIEEIDNQKKRQDEIGRNARVFSKQLDALRVRGRLSEGCCLQGGLIRVELNHQDLGDFSTTLDLQKYDNRILAVAHYFSKTTEEPVILVTKDLNLRIKADVLGIPAEDFYKDKIDFQELYSGVGECQLSADDLNLFYRTGKLPVREVKGQTQSIFCAEK